MFANFRQRLADLILFPNLLSIDAPVIAIAWQWLVWHCFIASNADSESGLWDASHPPVHTMVLLFNVVWMIYAADRLLDCRHLDFSKPVPKRHRFVQRWASWFWVTWVFILVVSIFVAVIYLQPKLWISGMLLSVNVAAYSAAVHAVPTLRQKLPKELIVGTIFATGVALPTATVSLSWQLAASLIMLAYLFTINCLIHAKTQQYSDQQQGIGSAIRIFPSIASNLPLFSVAGLIVCSTLYILQLVPDRYGLAIVISGFGLSICSIFVRSNSVQHREAVVGHLADYWLLSPLLILSFP